MTEETKDKELLRAIKELAEAQKQSACYLKRGRRLVEQLQEAAKRLETDLDVLDPDSDVLDDGSVIEIPSYASREEVAKLIRGLRESKNAEEHNARFVRSQYPCLKL